MTEAEKGQWVVVDIFCVHILEVFLTFSSSLRQALAAS